MVLAGGAAVRPAAATLLQPDPAKQGGLPDYVYANDDPLDVSDPSGLDGTPAQSPCTRQSYTNDPVQHANCNVAFASYNQDEANHDFAANLVGLGPHQSILERVPGFTTFLAGAGLVGRGLGLATDVVRGLAATGDAAAGSPLEGLLPGFAGSELGDYIPPVSRALIPQRYAYRSLGSIVIPAPPRPPRARLAAPPPIPVPAEPPWPPLPPLPPLPPWPPSS